jgi:hypothetical protein
MAGSKRWEIAGHSSPDGRAKDLARENRSGAETVMVLFYWVMDNWPIG